MAATFFCTSYMKATYKLQTKPGRYNGAMLVTLYILGALQALWFKLESGLPFPFLRLPLFHSWTLSWRLPGRPELLVSCRWRMYSFLHSCHCIYRTKTMSSRCLWESGELHHLSTDLSLVKKFEIRRNLYSIGRRLWLSLCITRKHVSSKDLSVIDSCNV